MNRNNIGSIALKMSKAIAIIDMPETCGECFFCGNVQDFYIGDGLYKKIARCLLSEDIEDPWRDLYWQSEHKEDWCPLKEIPEKYEVDKNKCSDPFYEFEFEHGYNQCIDEILRGDRKCTD